MHEHRNAFLLFLLAIVAESGFNAVIMAGRCQAYLPLAPLVILTYRLRLSAVHAFSADIPMFKGTEDLCAFFLAHLTVHFVQAFLRTGRRDTVN